MKRKNHVSVAEKNILLIFCILSFSLSTSKTGKPGSEPTQREKNYQISKMIPMGPLKAIYEKSDKKEMRVCVYIVKKSASNEAHDFNIGLYYSDPAGNMLPVGHQDSEEQLKKKAAFYINYLHDKGMSRQDLTLGYELKLTGAVVRNAKSLSVTIFPLQPARNTIHFIPILPSFPFSADDSCKIPPGCLISSTSYANSLNSSVEKIYSTEKKAN